MLRMSFPNQLTYVDAFQHVCKTTLGEKYSLAVLTFFRIYTEHVQMLTAPPVFATSSCQTPCQLIC